jgi:hypothetical protein
MKRFTVFTALFSVSILAGWMITQVFAASPAKNEDAPIKVHDAYSELLQVAQSADKAGIPVTGAEARKIAPVFDANGAVVSDPTGTILSGISSANVKIAPVFDATGAVISDPTGTLEGAIPSANPAIPVTDADVKIAPVFDATGMVVSDPNGTLWSASQP